MVTLEVALLKLLVFVVVAVAFIVVLLDVELVLVVLTAETGAAVGAVLSS